MENEGRPVDALDAVRRAQSRQGWSDRTTLAQCVAHVVARRSLYDRERIEAIAHALEEPSDADRVEAVAEHLEVCFGYFGSDWLDESLTQQPGLSDQEVEAVIVAFPGSTVDARAQRQRVGEGRRSIRQPALIVVGSLAAMIALAVVIVLLGG